MWVAVLMLAIASIINTIAIVILWRKYSNPSEVEVRFLPFEDEHPFLQLLIEEESEEQEPEPEQVIQVPVQTADYSAWRNQKDIQPWAPNSSAQSPQINSQERKPLERPPGFAS